MFGFSVSKLVVLVLIVLAVWWGFKLIGRLDAARREAAAEERRRVPPGGERREPGVKRGWTFPWSAGAAAKDAANRPAEAEEMVACEVCGAYVVRRGARSCGRPGCPYPG